jgi:hypothetical protein
MKIFAFNFSMNHFRCAFSTEYCKVELHGLIEIRMATSLRRASGPCGESLESFVSVQPLISCVFTISCFKQLYRAPLKLRHLL